MFLDSGEKLFALPNSGNSSCICRIAYSPIRNTWDIRKAVNSVFEQFRPDLVHVHGLWSWINHLSCLESYRRHLPYIVSPRGMLEPWSLEQKKWKKRFALWLYQLRDLDRSSAIHCTSSIETKNLETHGFRPGIFVVPNGTEIPELTPNRLVNAKKRVLFLSRIHSKKGILLLIEAWAVTAQPDWECVLCGPNSDGHLVEVRRRIAQLGLQNSIRILDEVEGEKKSELYRSADLFILPSHSENFGLVIAEALSFAIPVITTNKTPWAIIEKENCGWCVNDTAEEIGVALRQAMMMSDGERLAMGSRGRALAERQFKWDLVAKELAERYSKIVASCFCPCLQSNND